MIPTSHPALNLLNLTTFGISRYRCYARIKKERRKLVSLKTPAKMDYFPTDAKRLQKIAATSSHDPN